MHLVQKIALHYTPESPRPSATFSRKLSKKEEGAAAKKDEERKRRREKEKERGLSASKRRFARSNTGPGRYT